MRNVDLTLKNLDHPLDKIFGSIPAGSSAFTHASVRHYDFTSNLIDKLEKHRLSFLRFLKKSKIFDYTPSPSPLPPGESGG